MFITVGLDCPLLCSVPDLAAAVAEADPASPSFRAADAGHQDNLEAASSFEHWARRGNPWRQGATGCAAMIARNVLITSHGTSSDSELQ